MIKETSIVQQIAVQAGQKILEIYNDRDFSQVVDFKSDESPLTLADQAAHEIIVTELKKHYPNIPIISEEGAAEDYEQRRRWNPYWLVDPLDGTKEFINRNGEFTVNIALIEDNLPVFGVVHVPVTDTTYIGENGAAKKIVSGKEEPIQISGRKDKKIAVRSKSHAAPEEEEVLNRYGISDFISVGSSLKFCMVAEGKADIYYRHGPTMEWDTAAGQAVVMAAGGRVYLGNKEEVPFTYNKEDLLNSSFLVVG